MKNEIPKPVLFGVIAVVVALAGFGLWRGASGPGELPGPDAPKVIPKYVADMMSPADLEAKKREGYKVEDVQPKGPATGMPGVPTGN